VATTLRPPDADGLRHLAEEVRTLGTPVLAAIESMNGARFVHDTLELHGGDVEIADAQKVKGLAPLACKTDKIDVRVLAELLPSRALITQSIYDQFMERAVEFEYWAHTHLSVDVVRGRGSGFSLEALRGCARRRRRRRRRPARVVK
jgi:uncharacterized protein DUF779